MACIMGETCAGKSSFLEWAKTKSGLGERIGLVEVGKTLRAKYPPDHFAGRAAPTHTEPEAWNIFVDGVMGHIKDEAIDLILVDGQPRGARQASDIARMLGVDRVRFVVLWCSDERDVPQRAAIRFRDDPAGGALAEQRRINDPPDVLRTVCRLLEIGATVEAVDTSRDPQQFRTKLLHDLLNNEPVLP